VIVVADASPSYGDRGTAERRPVTRSLERRFEAVVLGWDGIVALDGSSDGAGVRQLLEAACAWGLHLGIVTGTEVADVDDRLGARPDGPGQLLLARGAELYRVGRLGPEPLGRVGSPLDAERRVTAPDASEASRRIFGRLWSLGVPAPLVLVAGDELAAARVPAADGDPAALLRLLEDQIERRRRGEPPGVVEDPVWSIVVEGTAPELERAAESRLALADGCIGTRGSLATPVPGASPGVFVAGVYQGDGAASRLLTAPLWNQVVEAAPTTAHVRRVLDLRAGLLHQELGEDGERLAVVQLSSAAQPGTAVLRATQDHVEPIEWAPPLEGSGVPVSSAGAVTQAHARLSGDPGGVAVAASQRATADGPSGRQLDRIAVFRSHPRRCPSLDAATAALREAERAGFERLLNEHRAAIGERWEHAGIAIPGDPELEQAVRFSLFHLIGSVADRGEAAVGARGLAGPGYLGHVFWDADVFVLPFLAATHPSAARAMLEYRIARLPAALAEAAAEGSAGAHFPWESAATGEEVTPSHGPDGRGRTVPILTGELEEHIVADIAWGACCYAAWSGDAAFLTGPGRGLLLETARWWAHRIELDTAGVAHIRGVAGPDEYHLPIDDNAFTNVMVRWNLRQAAALAERVAEAGVAGAEVARWRALADALVDGYDPATGIYEQFAGFHALEPLVIADVARHRPISAPLLLGDDRVTRAQVVKQADVMMLHHLVPDEVAPGSLAPNLDYYEPRTSHESSLSSGVYASLLARAGRVDEARDLLAQTASLDLHDLTGTTGGGVHIAGMGATWQALAWGFAGLRLEGEVLRIAPNLPDRWDALELRICLRGARLRLVLRHDHVEVDADRPVSVRVGSGTPRELSAGDHRIPIPRRADEAPER
jgi:trehalose/maltose hydrolase-like predicted phosphorylase